VAGSLAVLAVGACGPDDIPPAYLGIVVVDGGGASGSGGTGGGGGQGGSGDAGAPPPDPTVMAAACASPSPFDVAVTGVGAFGGLATGNAQIVLGLGGPARAFTPMDGCPGPGLPAPPVGSVSALASGSGVLWASSSSGLVLSTAGGKKIAACPGSAASLAVDAAGNALGIAANGTFFLATPGTGGTCAATTIPLQGGGVATAVAASAQAGTAWFGTVVAGVTTVRRYSVADGSPAGDPVVTWPICTADSIAELGDRLAVADATCGRVWFFHTSDGTLADSWATGAGATPRAVAAAPGGGALVVESSTTAGGTRIQLSKLP
jgi:hypothetical protein